MSKPAVKLAKMVLFVPRSSILAKGPVYGTSDFGCVVDVHRSEIYVIIPFLFVLYVLDLVGSVRSQEH